MTVAIPAVAPAMPDNSAPPDNNAPNALDSPGSFSSMLQNGMASNQAPASQSATNGAPSGTQSNQAPPTDTTGPPAPNSGTGPNHSEYGVAIHQYSNGSNSPSTPSPPALAAKQPAALTPVAPSTAAMSILAAAIVPLQPVAIPKTPVVSATGGTIGDGKASLATVGITTDVTSSRSAAVDIALAEGNGGAGAAQGTSIASGLVLPAPSNVPAKPGIPGPVLNSAAPAAGYVSDAVATAVSDVTTAQPAAQTSAAPSKNAQDSSPVVVGAELGQIPGTQVPFANPATAQTLLNDMSRTLALHNAPKPVANGSFSVPAAEVGNGATSTIASITFSKPVAISLPVGIAPQSIASGAAQVTVVASGSATTPLNSASTVESSPSAGSVAGGFGNTAVVKGPGQTGSSDTNTGAGQGQSQGRDSGAGTQQSPNFATVGSSPAVSAPGAGVASTASTAASLQDSTAARIAVANQVAQQIENQRLQGGTGRFVVNLHPAELGNVQVTVSQSRGVITARLVAETSQAQHALENGRQHLSQAFETRGIKVQSLQISLTSGGAGQHGAAFQTPHQSTLGNQQQTTRNSSTSGVPTPAEQSGLLPISSIGTVVGSNSMLDYRA